jgi:microcystin degradation protein MlrC
MIANADFVAGYQTYPHVDMYETGHRVGQSLFRRSRRCRELGTRSWRYPNRSW